MALKPGEWANDTKPHGSGQLQARRLASGAIAFYYRYTAPGRVQTRLPLGTELTLAEARGKASELSKRYQAGDRDLRAALEAEQRESARHQAAAEADQQAEAARKQGTLGVLLVAYCSQLAREGKVSAIKVEAALRLNVERAWPKLWITPAADLTPDDLLPVIARLADQNKLREADKLRSYISAAYTAAIRARQSARALPALRELKITTNPARDLATIDGARNARDRALSVAELGAYWRRICTLREPDGALLRFHLLTGAQRVEQLGRLTNDDLDRDTKSIRLLDGKGRRRQPRVHVVPLLEEAIQAIDIMQADRLGPYLCTVSHGHLGITYAAMQHRIRAIAETMQEAGELERGLFTVGDLRRTVETRLAAAGISLDVRAQLQSHGLGGVQARHYDRHDYLNEKRAALEALHKLLNGEQASLAQILGRWEG